MRSRFGISIILISGLIVLFMSQLLQPADLSVLNNVVILALFATATNLLIGTAGLMSLGQACFYGLGGYAIALAWRHEWAPFWVAVTVAPAVGASVALVVGALALRTRRWFFALITMAFSQLFFTVAQKLYAYTDGDNGIFGPMLPDVLLEPRNASVFIIVVTCGLLLLLRLVDQSPLGLTLRAARDNEGRAAGLGINVYRLQLKAFTISGAFCAAAGALGAVNLQGAHPGLLDWNMSGIPILVCVIGGMYTFLGPVLGAVVYQLCHDALVRFTTRWQIGLGMVLLAIVLAAPGGLAEAVVKLMRSLKVWLQGQRPTQRNVGS